MGTMKPSCQAHLKISPWISRWTQIGIWNSLGMHWAMWIMLVSSGLLIWMQSSNSQWLDPRAPLCHSVGVGEYFHIHQNQQTSWQSRSKNLIKIYYSDLEKYLTSVLPKDNPLPPLGPFLLSSYNWLLSLAQGTSKVLGSHVCYLCTTSISSPRRPTLPGVMHTLPKPVFSCTFLWKTAYYHIRRTTH